MGQTERWSTPGQQVCTPCAAGRWFKLPSEGLDGILTHQNYFSRGVAKKCPPYHCNSKRIKGLRKVSGLSASYTEA